MSTSGTCPSYIEPERYGRQVIWHEDPVFLDVTTTDLRLHFVPNGICIPTGWSGHYARWLSATGWILTQYNHQVYYDNLAQTSASASATTSFANPVFTNVAPGCPSGATYTDYFNYMNAGADGWVNMYYRGTASGQCSELLHVRVARTVG